MEEIEELASGVVVVPCLGDGDGNREKRWKQRKDGDREGDPNETQRNVQVAGTYHAVVFINVLQI